MHFITIQKCEGLNVWREWCPIRKGAALVGEYVGKYCLQSGVTLEMIVEGGIVDRVTTRNSSNIEFIPWICLKFSIKFVASCHRRRVQHLDSSSRRLCWLWLDK